MNEQRVPSPAQALDRMNRALRASPALRSAAYLSAAAGSAELMHRLIHNPESQDPFASYNFHYPLLPTTLALTYCFARLDPQDTQAWQQWPSRTDVRKLCLGAALGAAAISGFLGIAVAGKWASAPAWGWETAPAAQVMNTVTVSAANNAAAVWNEEMVFRGYGFDILRRAFGVYPAAVISTVLFAVYHGFGVRRLLALNLLGAVLLLLRLETGSLWFPIGFHWAWNIVQEAVIGNPALAPSIRPLHVRGPEAWIGRPGAVQPGWLVTLYLAFVFGVLLWRRGRTSIHPPGELA
jgi:membrane protease YdiL (CAAX protease family)